MLRSLSSRPRVTVTPSIVFMVHFSPGLLFVTTIDPTVKPSARSPLASIEASVKTPFAERAVLLASCTLANCTIVQGGETLDADSPNTETSSLYKATPISEIFEKVFRFGAVLPCKCITSRTSICPNNFTDSAESWTPIVVTRVRASSIILFARSTIGFLVPVRDAKSFESNTLALPLVIYFSGTVRETFTNAWMYSGACDNAMLPREPKNSASTSRTTFRVLQYLSKAWRRLAHVPPLYFETKVAHCAHSASYSGA